MEPEKSRVSGALRGLGQLDESGYRFLNDTNTLAALSARRQRRRRLRDALAPWYRLSAPPEPPASAPFAVRDQHRRARLASALILGFTLVGLAQLPFELRSGSSLVIGSVALLVFAGLVWLNRAGQTNAVGALMLLVSYGILGFAAAPGGRLNAGSPLTFDLLVVTELIAVTILPPISVLVVAAINCVAILAAIALLPHDASFAALVARSAGSTLIARALALQTLVAVVAYLWARSAVRALRRADRAEEIALLERREVERTREIEEGVRQLQATLVQLANGDFSARVPPVRNALLWQVGVSVNNLIGRLGRLTQGAPDNPRLREEARQLADTIFAWSRGAQPIWPAPSGSPLDEVTLTLRRTLGQLATPTGGPGMAPSAPSGDNPTSQAPASYAPVSLPTPVSHPIPAIAHPPVTPFTYPDLYPTQAALTPSEGVHDGFGPAAPHAGLLAPPDAVDAGLAYPPLDSYPSLGASPIGPANDMGPTQPALPEWLTAEAPDGSPQSR